MNTSRLNGTLLGTGVTDARVFIYLSATVTAVATMVLYAKRYLVSTVTPTATGAMRLDGVFQIALSITARATSAIATSKYYAKYLTSAIIARATDVNTLTAIRALASSITAAASSAYAIWRGRTLSGEVQAGAATAARAENLGFSAPEDRIMVISAEDRTMKVT